MEIYFYFGLCCGVILGIWGIIKLIKARRYIKYERDMGFPSLKPADRERFLKMYSIDEIKILNI